MSDQSDLDRYYRRNVFGISAVEFLWGLGLPVVIESTFLQLFLKNMGASSLAIGLIPFFFFVGISVFALLSSYMTENMALKRYAVILLHIISGAMLVLIGLGLLLFGQTDYFLVIFFCCYAIFSILIGMTLPVWWNYLLKILSEERSVSGLAFMLIAQNIAKLTGSIYIVHFVDRYAFSVRHSAWIFVVIGIIFSFSAVFFLLTKEFPQDHAAASDNDPLFFQYVRESLEQVWRNKNFLTFLAGDVDLYVIITIISFYANYATTYRGIAPALAAGAFVGCIYIGAICANILLGPLGLFSLKGKYVFEKSASLYAILILIFFGANWSFLLASFLLGIARGTRMLTYAPAVKKLSGLSDSTRYFAVAPIITLPLSAALPLLCGKFLDRFQELGGNSYRIVFIMAFVLVFVSLGFILKTDFSPVSHHPSKLAKD